jgi:HPt (histidine-containing phosphotransfer) domain-containing protein
MEYLVITSYISANSHIMDEILFDTALLDEIGSKKSTIRVLEYYLEDSPKYLLDLEKLLAEKDFPGIINKSHKLKGSLGMLKADLLVSLINQLETAASTELNFDKSQELLALLKEKLLHLDMQLLQEIKKIKDSL